MTDGSSQCVIRSAVVPAAGHGTRLRPLTAAIPKEMLPLGRKPVLEHVLEELCAAEIERVVIVLSPAKKMIREYFGDGSALGIRIEYALQPEMRGLGDALLCAEDILDGEPFAVAFGDCVIEGTNASGLGTAPLARLVRTRAHREADAVVLAETVALERVSRYGILRPASPIADSPGDEFPICDVVEKPSASSAPSRQAVAARWILPPAIFDRLRNTAPGANGELDLTDAVRGLLADGARVWAVPLIVGERRLDIGGWDTYLDAVARYAAADREFGPRVRAELCGGATN